MQGQGCLKKSTISSTILSAPHNGTYITHAIPSFHKQALAFTAAGTANGKAQAQLCSCLNFYNYPYNVCILDLKRLPTSK
jgi:hypothetical protein